MPRSMVPRVYALCVGTRGEAAGGLEKRLTSYTSKALQKGICLGVKVPYSFGPGVKKVIRERAVIC